ncbi:MAG: helix-turn-helix transcriptional regulator [Clostridia bacterium]|nr:helix-turn-helix transcriptional regulator [Clostridia bacterium]
MAKAFDRQRMLSNISKIIQDRGIKIGELENNVGVSAGYLSRLSKEENKTIPAIDIIWKIAKALKVNTELLIEGSFEHETENLNYMTKFVQKLFERTVSGELDWNCYHIGDIASAIRGDIRIEVPFIETDPDHIFQDELDDLRMQGVTYGTITAHEHTRVRSYSRPTASLSVAGPTFYVHLDDQRMLHIIKYVELMYFDADEDSPGFPEPVDWYELVLDEPYHRETESICNTLGTCVVLRPDIEKLYQQLRQHEYDLRINKNVKKVIDSFMADDELPF